MYDRLATTLVSFIAVWVMFALVVAAMAFGIIPLPGPDGPPPECR